MESVLADVRQSLRLLRKSPGFTAVAIAALALGIGANTGIFSVINKVILEPLPYPQPERIVKLGRKYPDGTGYSNSVPKYMAWRHNDVFSEMAIYDQGGPGLNLTAGDRPEQVKGIHVSADYFKVFGASPMRGRYFSAQEDSPNGPKAAIISEKLWRSRFGGDPQMVGRTIQLNGEAYPVVGIMPGVTIEQARGEMKRVGEGFRRENPKWMDKNESVAVVPMREAMVGNVKIALYVLLGAVLLVLLIACANVANLLLARAATRQRELAIRAAIGATRGRVIRQLLTESVILACIGGICGLLLGGWGVRTLLLFVPGDIPRLTSQEHVQGLFSILDWRIVLFAVGVSFLTGIIFGLFPALHISNPDVASTLREASGRTGTGRKQNRVRKVLVGIEMALALVLLTSAVLLIRTFVGLSSVQSGIDPHNVLTLQTSLAGGNYSTTDKVDRFATQVVRRLETLPGVQSAALAVALPTQTEIDLPFAIAGKAPKSGQTYNGDEQYRFISPHYFAVFKIPLLRGRYFDERDVQNGAKVVIINQAMAKKYWPKDDALGAVITIGKGLGPQFEDAPRQVVGIVGDVRESGLADKDVGVMYLPQSQVPDGVTQLANSALPLGWCIRTATDPNTLRTAVQREFQAVDSLMPVSKMRPMEEVLAEGVARQRFNMLLLSIFAGIALILAAIGIYGLMSYSVEQQTQELGIRMALGAGRAEVLRLIVRQGMIPAIAGVAVGLAIAFALTQLLSTLLYGVKPNDPLTYASVALVLLLVALFSTWVPALRAARIDPATALRDEV